MTQKKPIVVTIFCGLLFASVTRAASTPSSLRYHSPNGKIEVALSLAEAGEIGGISYSVSLKKQKLFKNSALGLRLDALDLLTGLRLKSVSEKKHLERYTLPIGKNKFVINSFREVDLDFVKVEAMFQIQFRIYDDGVAYRYVLPPATAGRRVVDERGTFAPSGDLKIFALPVQFGGAYEEKYVTGALNKFSSQDVLALPLALRYRNGAYVLITEANLHNYPQSYLSVNTESSLGVRYPAPTLSIEQSPWRVMMIGSSEREVLESNLIANLNEDPEFETSWVHPGKVLFQWWNGYVTPGRTFSPPESVLNTQTLKRHIDFCAQYGIEFFSLDGYEFDRAWYGGKVFYEGQDVTVAAPDIDLEAVLSYAREKKVRVRIWLSTEGLTDANMEKVLSTYEKWGAAGIMVDFMGNDTQAGVAHAEKILQLTAKHHLTVGFHGFAKPTGWSRTYPHFLNQEGVLGQEYNKWVGHNSDPDHEVNIAFVRGAVGPMDTHEGSFRPVPLARFQPKSIGPNGIGTLARQLAMYVVYENEQPMLADYPEAYEKYHSAFDFVRQVPVSWDQTVFVDGSLERKHITMARRSGRDWYLGSMTGIDSASYEISLAFLGAGDYRLESYEDTKNSAEDGEQLQLSKSRLVTAESKLLIKMSPAGGHAARLLRVD